MGFPGDSDGKVSACNAGDQVQFLDREDPLEKEMVIQSSTLAWKALGITYYLHCAWRPQSPGKVERANQFLKSVTKKITQETSLGWKEALPIALLCTRIAPKGQAGLNVCEMLYGRPFVMSMTSS